MLSTSTTSIYTHSVSWSFDMLHSTEQFIVVPGLFIRVYSMFVAFQASLTSLLMWCSEQELSIHVCSIAGSPQLPLSGNPGTTVTLFWKVFILWQDASTIPCLCVWVITSVEDSVAAEATEHIQGSMEGHVWDLQDLAVIWRTLLTRQKSKTLIRGFQLFFKVVIVTLFLSCV